MPPALFGTSGKSKGCRLFRTLDSRLFTFSFLARYKRIREMVKADKEEEVMAVADKDSHRLREYYKALDTLGKIIWGYRGRKLARRRKREARLEEVATSTKE